jgi:hypothetical protein
MSDTFSSDPSIIGRAAADFPANLRAQLDTLRAAKLSEKEPKEFAYQLGGGPIRVAWKTDSGPIYTDGAPKKSRSPLMMS